MGKARSLKYGEVTTEHGEFLEEEPVVVFRGRDRILPALLEVYREMCADAGSPEQHTELLDETYERVQMWQEENPDEVKIPESNAYAERVALENEPDDDEDDEDDDSAVGSGSI